MTQLSIILPAYKERDNLAVLVPQVEEEFKNLALEVIIVDDHSMDGTRELAEEFKAKYGNVVLLERPGLLGIGSALRDGYNLAHGEYILSSDSDLSFSSGDMRRLYEKIMGGFDLVLGYKVADASFETTKTHGLGAIQAWCENYVVSPMSNVVIGFLSGVGLKNYNTNFRVIRASVWKRIHTEENKLFFLFETIVRAKQAGARITEIPVTFSARKFGTSKISFFKLAPKYFLLLLRILFFDKRR